MRSCLDAGLVQVANLNTMQGNVGLNGHTSDHSNSGCSVIALLIVSACLAGIATTFIFEKIIDIICQKPLQKIRRLYYPNMGFVFVSAEESLEELIELGLLERPDVSTTLFFILMFQRQKNSLCSFFSCLYRQVDPTGLFVTDSPVICSKMLILFKCLFRRS